MNEGDGQVEVCVSLISPEEDVSIGDESILLEVFTNTNPGSIPDGSTPASELALLE